MGCPPYSGFASPCGGSSPIRLIGELILHDRAPAVPARQIKVLLNVTNTRVGHELMIVGRGLMGVDQRVVAVIGE